VRTPSPASNNLISATLAVSSHYRKFHLLSRLHSRTAATPHCWKLDSPHTTPPCPSSTLHPSCGSMRTLIHFFTSTTLPHRRVPSCTLVAPPFYTPHQYWGHGTKGETGLCWMTVLITPHIASQSEALRERETMDNKSPISSRYPFNNRLIQRQRPGQGRTGMGLGEC